MSVIDTSRGWDTLMVTPLQVEHLLPGDDSGDSWVTADSDLYRDLLHAGCPLEETGLYDNGGVMFDLAIQDGHVVAHSGSGKTAHVMDGGPVADLVLAWLEAQS